MARMTLHTAARQGDLEAIRNLHAAGKDLNAKDRSGRTPLIAAAREGQGEAIELLLELGADPNEASEDGFTALIAAAQSGNRPVVHELLNAGADVNQCYKGESALYRASDILLLEIMQDLLDAGGDPNLAAAGTHTTALMRVIREWPQAEEDKSEKQRQADQFMAQFAGDVDERRRTLCPKACEMLLQAGADVNAHDRNGQTALMLAAQRSCTAAVEMLLAGGADPAVEDRQSKTASDYLRDDTPAGLRRLLEQAMAGASGPSPQKALAEAIDAGDPGAVEAALGRGAEANPEQAVPPLLTAAGKGNAEVVRLLVEAGARVDPVRREDEHVPSALVAAAEAGHADVARVLLDAGADLAAADQGRDAVLVAASKRHWEAVDVLLAAGFEHSDLDAYLALRPFPATAQQPAFRAWIDRLAQRLACEAAEVKDLPGVCTFSLAKKETQEKDPMAFLASVQDDQRRKAAHQAIVAEWGDGVQADGYHLVVAGLPVGLGSEVLLVPSPNQYAILAALGTNGCNYGLGTPDVIRWLGEMHQQHPFLIDGVGHDKVEGRFLQPIEDASALAERMYKFCPDIVDQGTGSVEALAKELARQQRFFFWWD